MYYPYVRGKQFELILLRDNAKLLAENNIHPIIEPVKKDFRALIRAITKMEEHKVNYTVIVNPQVGIEPVQMKDIQKNLLNEISNVRLASCI